MKNNKITTIIVVLATILLAGVAIYTAIRLYQLRAKPVAPNVPESKPAAAGTVCGGIQGTTCPVNETCIYANGSTVAPSADATGICTLRARPTAEPIICQLRFTLATPTPSPTPTPTRSPSPSPTPTRSPSPSPSPSPNPLCNSACTSSAQCPSGLSCYIPTGLTAGNCRNMACSTVSSCACPTPSPSPTPTRSPSPTPTKSPSPSPTPLVTASPSPTPIAQCNSTCSSSASCPSGLSCYIPNGATTGNCRNASCTSQTSCVCATTNPTITPTPTSTNIAYVPTASPAPQPTLPESGTDWPTILGAIFGVFVIVGSVLLAF